MLSFLTVLLAAGLIATPGQWSDLAGGTPAQWAWGFAAATASMLIPYINALRPTAPRRLLRRAERILLCSVAAAASVPLWALVAIAVVGNLDAARTFWLVIRAAPGPVNATKAPRDR